MLGLGLVLRQRSGRGRGFDLRLEMETWAGALAGVRAGAEDGAGACPRRHDWFVAGGGVGPLNPRLEPGNGVRFGLALMQRLGRGVGLWMRLNLSK